jgi:hypothetical protein
MYTLGFYEIYKPGPENVKNVEYVVACGILTTMNDKYVYFDDYYSCRDFINKYPEIIDSIQEESGEKVIPVMMIEADYNDLADDHYTAVKIDDFDENDLKYHLIEPVYFNEANDQYWYTTIRNEACKGPVITDANWRVYSRPPYPDIKYSLVDHRLFKHLGVRHLDIAYQE